MSRLVGYGAGEIVDRLTILELKLLHGTANHLNTTHFQVEWAALVPLLSHRERYFHEACRLGVVNATLWLLEDTMRIYEQCEGAGGQNDDGDVAECAISIKRLNDQRAALVAQINTLAGDPTAPEKL